jgi:hypothetical protein
VRLRRTLAALAAALAAAGAGAAAAAPLALALARDGRVVLAGSSDVQVAVACLLG